MAKFSVKGMKQTLLSLKKFGKEADKQIHIITGDNATQIELNAKINAPVDLGKLRQSIKVIEKAKADFKIVVLAPYAAYMEFGTGTRVKVPTELQEIAMQFKGKGVKEVNLQPQPFLYPAFVKGREQYLKDLKQLLEVLTSKYN